MLLMTYGLCYQPYVFNLLVNFFFSLFILAFRLAIYSLYSFESNGNLVTYKGSV